MCLKLAQRGIERALTHRYLESEIAAEFPQHWLGLPLYYDISVGEHRRTRLYLVPRDRGDILFLLTDREDTVKRVVPDEADRIAIVASSRSAFVFRLDCEISFRRDFRQPNNFAEFLAWLENMVPGTVAERSTSFLASSRPIWCHCLSTRQMAASALRWTPRTRFSRALSAGRVSSSLSERAVTR